MTGRTVAIALAGIVSLVAMSQTVVAEQNHPPRKRVRQQSVAPPPARVCQRLCVADVTPCDPIQYKIADGRCSDPLFLY